MAIVQKGNGWEEAGLTVVTGTAAEVSAIQVPPNASQMGLEIKNADDTSALDALIISYRITTGGEYNILADADANFTSPQLPITNVEISTGTAFTALPAEAYITMKIDVAGVETIQIKASTAGGAATTMDLNYSFN